MCAKMIACSESTNQSVPCAYVGLRVPFYSAHLARSEGIYVLSVCQHTGNIVSRGCLAMGLLHRGSDRVGGCSADVSTTHDSFAPGIGSETFQ
jgi:hypothetical protein